MRILSTLAKNQRRARWKNIKMPYSEINISSHFPANLAIECDMEKQNIKQQHYSSQ
jgi:hypothetical protein